MRNIVITYENGRVASHVMRHGYEVAAERAGINPQAKPSSWLAFVAWMAARREQDPEASSYPDAWGKWVDAEVVDISAAREGDDEIPLGSGSPPESG